MRIGKKRNRYLYYGISRNKKEKSAGCSNHSSQIKKKKAFLEGDCKN